jgi:prepilin-type N-terminal cleavage/methylation domain-containing protein
MGVYDRADGFTLIEVLVATTLVCTAVAGLSQLGLLAMAQSLSVQRQTAALWLAQSKLEELRARSWAFDSSGLALSDPALSLSPPGALTSDTPGFVDYFDRFGDVVPRPVSTYQRRWAITLVDPVDPDTLRLQSCVLSRAPASAGRSIADACVTTIRTRRLR